MSTNKGCKYQQSLNDSDPCINLKPRILTFEHQHARSFYIFFKVCNQSRVLMHKYNLPKVQHQKISKRRIRWMEHVLKHLPSTM